MRTYRYRILNVFAETTFGGNPLCVFEDGSGLSDAEMQALALQFNLSETTFILPSRSATARVRIFTPGYEMPFAGHPTLGTSHVVRALTGVGDSLTLEMRAGVVPVQAQGDTWTLVAPGGGAPEVRRPVLPAATIAAQLGVSTDDLLSEPLWLDTGAHQLLVPLKSVEAVRRARPDAARLDEWEASKASRRVAYVFAFDLRLDDPAGHAHRSGDGRRPHGGNADPGEGGDGSPPHGGNGVNHVLARYFFVKPGGGVVEDPGTGSACANLGGWCVATGRSLPLHIRVAQGEQAGRPCVMGLRVTADGRISVSGQVLELGSGSIKLP
ncbi:phenazine biosynthesis protein PhzC/PhzF [Bordetella sp. H567]|uniref:PhzF family phenazine biosynthesis protein n=1 Tax=Bordetella sp. H567 TaxID=1697043 RepID=UPI00081C568B|nr:PhzF family phenazine biosynthesis protein [Bordetella sp. H567]AOB32105.1 phenazine biosynthesis protein PhzC/PhzF [Bordetella sp. H567]